MSANYEEAKKVSSHSVPSPTLIVMMTDRLTIAAMTATIAAGKWALFSSMMLLSSPINTAGTMIAVSTEMGINFKAPLKYAGNLRGAMPDSIT